MRVKCVIFGIISTISTAAKTTTKRPANPGKTMPTVTSNGEQPTALPDNFTYVLCNRSNNDEASSSSSTIQQLPKKLKNTKDQSAEEEDMDTDVSTSSVEEVMLAENATNNAQEEESEEAMPPWTAAAARKLLMSAQMPLTLSPQSNYISATRSPTATAPQSLSPRRLTAV